MEKSEEQAVEDKQADIEESEVQWVISEQTESKESSLRKTGWILFFLGLFVGNLDFDHGYVMAYEQFFTVALGVLVATFFVLWIYHDNGELQNCGFSQRMLEVFLGFSLGAVLSLLHFLLSTT